MEIHKLKNGFALYINTEQMKKTGSGMKETTVDEVIQDLEETIEKLKSEDAE